MTETAKAADVIQYTLNQCCQELAKALDAEVLTIRSPILRGLDDQIRIEVERIVRDSNDGHLATLPRLVVVLETTGGLIEVVERISNVFRRHFGEVTFIVPGYAFSAGTVLVLSGDHIYMDYYSVLGPIDPQIQDDNNKLIPGMAYLYMYDDLIEKSRNETITKAELLFLTKRFDPATIFIIEQAKNHSEDLIRDWLPKYKFRNWDYTETRGKEVTPDMKAERAGQIAEELGNAARWHSHGRGITMEELMRDDIGLKIEDFGSDEKLSGVIRQYYDLFVDYGQRTGAEYAIHSKMGLRGL